MRDGEWLSPEGLESEPYELKSDDIVVSRLFLPREVFARSNQPQ
jgi:hypothetical protein